MQSIEHGNVHTKPNGQRDWILGYFIEPNSPFHTKDFEINWFNGKQGQKKNQVKYNKTAKTLTILAHGKFRVDFSRIGRK